jgi:hypothetical protein
MTRIRIIIATCLLTALLFSTSSCDEKTTLNDVKNVIAPVLITAFENTRRDPEVSAAFLRGGWDEVRNVAPPVFVQYVRNGVTELGLKGELERKVYDYLSDEWPRLALVLYRETPQGPAGIWVRFDLWAKSEGFDSASIWLIAELTDEQRNFLLDRLPQVVWEEWKAVEDERELSQTTPSPEPAAQPADD